MGESFGVVVYVSGCWWGPSEGVPRAWNGGWARLLRLILFIEISRGGLEAGLG